MSLAGALLERVERRMDLGPFSTLAEPNRTILEAFGGGPVAAGVRVSELIAEGIPAVYGCVDILANTIAQLPLKLMENLQGGGRQDAVDHPLYSVLHSLANPEMTAFDFRTTMERWKLLWGNAYAEIQRDGQGRVRALWPLRSDRMQVTRDTANVITYTYRLADGSTKIWKFDSYRPPIFHLRINSLDGILGRSPIRVLRESIGWTLATQQFGQRFYNNNASPRGILSAPQFFTKEQRETLRRSWDTHHQGVENAHRIAVLEGGLDFKPIGMPLDDAQFIETVGFHYRTIAGDIYHVPPFLRGDTEKATSWGTGLEQQAIGLVTFTLMPHLVSWSQAIARDLLTFKSFETHTAVFVTKALVRGDFKSRMDGHAVQIQNGMESPDEARAEEDLPPRPDGLGGEYWRPANFTTDSADGPTEPEPTPTPDPVPEPALAGAGGEGSAEDGAEGVAA